MAEQCFTVTDAKSATSYQYLQVLPQLAQGDANNVFVIPSEFAEAFGGFGEALGLHESGAPDS
jgi:hypothetical protein